MTSDRHEQRAREIATPEFYTTGSAPFEDGSGAVRYARVPREWFDSLPERIASALREEAERCAEPPYGVMWADTLERAAEKIVAAWRRCRDGEFATPDEELDALEGPIEDMERLLREPDEPRGPR